MRVRPTSSRRLGADTERSRGTFVSRLETRARTIARRAPGSTGRSEGSRASRSGIDRSEITGGEVAGGGNSGGGGGSAWDDAPEMVLARQIALALDHLDRSRCLHESMLRQLLRIECYIDTELMQRAPRPHSYIDVYRPERDRLKDKLLRLEDERRRLALLHHDRTAQIFDRLLALVHQHGYLGV